MSLIASSVQLKNHQTCTKTRKKAVYRNQCQDDPKCCDWQTGVLQHFKDLKENVRIRNEQRGNRESETAEKNQWEF